MVTKVVNLRKNRFDFYIGRRNRFVDPNYGTGNGPTTEKGYDGFYGNPFTLRPRATDAERDECLTLFKQYFYQRLAEDEEFRVRVHALRGKVLGCFCSPKPCHGDVIAEYLEATHELG